LTWAQVDVLQGTISAAAHQKYLDIKECDFANDGSLEQILLACTMVERMDVRCKFISQYSALLALFQDLANNLEILLLYVDDSGPDSHEIARVISTSLANNNELKSLNLNWQREKMTLFSNGSFHNLLCDPTSIQSIKNSNHTLEEISAGSHRSPSLVTEYLELNAEEDKTQVVRNKILKHYFVNDFDVTPFTNMPVSVVPEMISQIRSDTKQSAIFSLFKCIPELSKVGSRSLLTERARKTRRQRI
jgi:hypothetical protein